MSGSTDLTPAFIAAGSKYNVDPRLLMAVAWQESNGDPNARSPAGAQGLMQLMPATAKTLGVNPYDPVQAIDGGARVLAQNLDRYGNVPDALRAYNAGTDQSHWNNKETLAYVPGVAAKFAALPAFQPAPVAGDQAAPSAVSQAGPVTASGGVQVADSGQVANDASPPDAFGARYGSLVGGAPAKASTSAPSADAFGARYGALLKPDASGASPAAAASQPTSAASASNAGSTLGDVGRGIAQGYKDVAQTAAQGLAWAGRQAAAIPGVQTAADATGLPQAWGDMLNRMDADRQAFDASNPGTAAQIGRVVGQMAATAPALGPIGDAAGAVGGAARAAAAGNPLLSAPVALATRVGQGAAAGAAANALTSAASPDGVAGQAKSGALIGGALGAAGSAARGIGNALAPQMDAATAAIYNRANQYGIDLAGWRLSNNPLTKFIGDQADAMPGSGAQAADMASRRQFTAAVAQQMGETANALTPAVMQGARDRIGQAFDQVAAQTSITPDHAFLNQLATIETQARSALGHDAQPIQNQITDVLDAAVRGNGAIQGDAYQALTARGGPLDVLANRGNPTQAYYGTQIRNALDDALQRSVPQQLQGQLTQARYQWRVMRTIEPLAEKAQQNADGVLDPKLLAGRLRQTDDMLAYTGGGPLGDLAQIGTLFRDPPNSGTPGRLLAMSLPGSAATALTGSPGPLLANVGTLAGGAGVSRLMRTPAYTNMLLGNSPLGTGTVNDLASLVGSQAAPAVAMQGRNMLMVPPPNQP